MVKSVDIEKMLEHLKTFDVAKDLEKRSICPRCNKSKVWFDEYCQECELAVAAEAREKKHQDYLAKLSQNSLEIRLRHIESWIYKHAQNHPEKEWRMI